MFYEYLVKTNKEAFLQKVKDISAKLGIDPDWLMIVMKMESGINEKAVNPDGGATGLIQFMPVTAASMGTSTSELLEMSNTDQLDYVYQYFKPYAGKLKSVTDLYIVTFFPVALGKPDNYVLQTSRTSAAQIARQNPIFDLNNDQAITLGEFKQSVLSRMPNEVIDYLKKN